MLYIIWGILNITALIYFIIICFKSVKIIREKLGFPATLIFIIGLGSFMAGSEKRKIETDTVNLRQPEMDKSRFKGNTYGTEVPLENNLAAEIHLHITHGENAAGKTLLSATASRDGFVSGTNWRVQSISVDKIANSNAYSYYVFGSLDWRILGITVYTEAKHFEGKTALTH